jgi:hypothetical protein
MHALYRDRKLSVSLCRFVRRFSKASAKCRDSSHPTLTDRRDILRWLAPPFSLFTVKGCDVNYRDVGSA